MIRVGHLLPNMAIGGRERIVADLCRHAAINDVAPILIAYDPIGPDTTLIDVGDAPIHTIDRHAGDFTGRLRALLASESIDILHAQGHIAAALARPALDNVPMLATLHIALGTGWRWTLPVARGLRAARGVTAVSDDLARRYRLLAGQPITVIPTGVDLERFQVKRSFHGLRPFTLGIAARLHPVKRHEDVIAALKILATAGYSCRLRIAGQGPRGRQLAKLAQGLDVTFDGDVPDMPRWLAGLDAFVLVSDHEGTPAALLEAMAAGLPCVATTVGGIPDLVGDTCLLVTPRQPAMIANALISIIDDQPLAQRLSRSAAARAAKFPATTQARHYATAYRHIISP